jgi:hypothetical protein
MTTDVEQVELIKDFLKKDICLLYVSGGGLCFVEYKKKGRK